VTILQTIDNGSTSFSLLVPLVNLGLSNQAHVNTDGITTMHRFSVVPILNQGQIELYSVTKLSGSAEMVAF
jgi:hypothetical protein